MKKIIFKKKSIIGIIALMSTVAMLATAMLVWQGNVLHSNAHNSGAYYLEQGLSSSATVDDNFCDSTILVVMTRTASQNGHFAVQDFAELFLVSVQCITPGFVNGIRERSNFRRILKLILANPCKQNVLDGIRLLETRQDIQSAEPNFIFNIECEPVYSYDNLFGSFADSFSSNLYWAQERIGVPQAQQITRGCSSVTVAVVDSGIQGTHHSLIPLLDKNRGLALGAMGAHNYNPHYDAGPSVDILRGHGTLSAGLVSSPSTGVAQNVRLVSIRTGLEVSIEYFIRIINHVDYYDIPIINFSRSAFLAFNPNQAGILSSLIEDWNGLFVASAMNSNLNLDATRQYPARLILPNLITVGASDKSEQRERQSNFSATRVCVFAPGTQLRTTEKGGDYYNDYGRTSGAAPLVSGTAALMMSINPYLRNRPDIVRQIIIETAYRPNINGVNPLHGLSVSNGRLDTYAAVRRAKNELPFTFEHIGSTHNVRVRLNPLQTYTGHFEIPATIVIDGVTSRVVEISPFAFAGSNLTSITLPSSIHTIGRHAFESSSIQSVTFAGGNLQRIGDGAFLNTPYLESITAANQSNRFPNLTHQNYLPYNLFRYSGIRRLTLGSGVREIRQFAFAWTSRLISLNFDTSASGVRYIRTAAFRNSSVSAVSLLSQALQYIGDNAFMYTPNFTALTLSNVEFIGNSAFSNSGLNTVAFTTNRIRHIGNSAFAGNFLTQITIPDSVDFIGSQAFMANPLTSITLFRAVTSIAQVPTLGVNAFLGTPIGANNPSARIYVPNQVSVAHYQNAPNWSNASIRSRIQYNPIAGFTFNVPNVAVYETREVTLAANTTQDVIIRAPNANSVGVFVRGPSTVSLSLALMGGNNIADTRGARGGEFMHFSDPRISSWGTGNVRLINSGNSAATVRLVFIVSQTSLVESGSVTLGGTHTSSNVAPASRHVVRVSSTYLNATSGFSVSHNVDFYIFRASNVAYGYVRHGRTTDYAIRSVFTPSSSSRLCYYIIVLSLTDDVSLSSPIRVVNPLVAVGSTGGGGSSVSLPITLDALHGHNIRIRYASSTIPHYFDLYTTVNNACCCTLSSGASFTLPNGYVLIFGWSDSSTLMVWSHPNNTTFWEVRLYRA